MFKLNELFRLVDTKVIFYFGLTKATGTQKTIINVKYSFFITLTHISYTYFYITKNTDTPLYNTKRLPLQNILTHKKIFPKNKMKKKYKMIVLDLDGTLTNNNKVITPKTKNALIRAQEQGIRLVLASGRPTYGIAPLAQELQLKQYHGYILAFNGAKIIDCASGNTLFEQTLPVELVPTLYEKAIEHHMNILTYQGEKIAATSTQDKYVKEEARINKLPITLYPNFLKQIVYPINKCLIVGDPTPLHLLETELSKTLEGKMSIYRSADYFLECVPLNVDKALSIAKLLKLTNIKREEIIACGDGYNDLSMIKYAGLGVAMANANEDIRLKADYVTLSNEEDGVAKVIDTFIL